MIQEGLPAFDGRAPYLCIFRKGNEPDDLSYEKTILSALKKAGLSAETRELPEDGTEESILKKLSEADSDPEISGILLLSPGSFGIQKASLEAVISEEKDLDLRASCTAEAVILTLKRVFTDLSGIKTALIGRSEYVGKPILKALLKEGADVSVINSKTEKPDVICRNAQILVSAAGKAGLVTESYVKPGAVLIDVGISKGPDGKFAGDIRLCEEETEAAYLTPVPGGIGSMTTGVLLKHLWEGFLKQQWKRSESDILRTESKSFVTSTEDPTGSI